VDLDVLSRGQPSPGQSRPRVAVDAMGGDHAPEEVVRGTVDWARRHSDTDVILVGDEARIRQHVEGPLPDHVRIVPASQAVGMDEQPAVAVRRKRDASINVAMRLVRDGEADAVVTAGHTGAGVASAILHLKRLPGVDRPALAVQMITESGPLTLLDIGATTDSTGLNLAQYAHMGSLFAQRVMGVPDPSVALLSIGEEAGKGEQRVQEATELLRASGLRFVGNVEGRDLPRHPADVVVCDASVGNVVMKFFEGLSTTMFDLLRREFRRPPWGPIGYLFMRPGIRRLRRRFDYERLGGAPLLGVNGTVLITHGGARRRMIGHAVEVTAAAARARIPERIAAALAASPPDAAAPDAIREV
jgi:phosphate acyltransferase